VNIQPAGGVGFLNRCLSYKFDKMQSVKNKDVKTMEQNGKNNKKLYSKLTCLHTASGLQNFFRQLLF